MLGFTHMPLHWLLFVDIRVSFNGMPPGPIPTGDIEGKEVRDPYQTLADLGYRVG